MEKELKPFCRWLGGKTQILPDISKYYPFSDNVTKYVEPFVGAGIVLFDILNNYNLSEIYINDINKELIDTYLTIRDNINELVLLLEKCQEEVKLLDKQSRILYYNEKKKRFNELILNKNNVVEKSFLFLFLNKTCFNGIYRVNSKSLFNSYYGRDLHKKDFYILDINNLILISEKLKNINIFCSDYLDLESIIDKNTFVYLDPPYRPISNTSDFVRYTKGKFNDKNQIELAYFVKRIHQKGTRFLLSNSDPKNMNSEDTFFDKLYKDFYIERVSVNRCGGKTSVNRKYNITELLISNITLL